MVRHLTLEQNDVVVILTCLDMMRKAMAKKPNSEKHVSEVTSVGDRIVSQTMSEYKTLDEVAGL